MARRRNQDSLDELFEVLMDCPWWVSIIVGVITYVGMRFIVPMMWTDGVGAIWAKMISNLAWVSVMFVLPAAGSAMRAARKRTLFDKQSGIDSIRSLPWKRFEELLGEAYRRQGFSVTENAGVGADGGIDLTLQRDGQTYLVQCKQWKTYKVGVKVVREMLGLVTAHRAAGAIVVTSGGFTKEARDFAANQPIELVDGEMLARMTGVSRTVSTSAPAPTAARMCPRCGSSLVLRTARRGTNAGSTFWGCSGYPQCRHTESAAG